LAFPTQHRFRQYAPLLASAAIVVLFGLYLATQITDWLRLTRTPAEVAGAREPAAESAPDLARMELLFGTPPASSTYAPQASGSSIALLGSFVHSNPERSSAIIQVGGNPPQLYRINDELEPGVRLYGVHADRIDLARGDALESLFFPAIRASGMADQAQAPVYEEPTAPTTQADPEQLRLQLEMLRQQIEETAGAAPSAEQPTEDD
jgi:general secretion pathway protein C